MQGSIPICRCTFPTLDGVRAGLLSLVDCTHVLYLMAKSNFFIPGCDRQEFVQAFAASNALPGDVSCVEPKLNVLYMN